MLQCCGHSALQKQTEGCTWPKLRAGLITLVVINVVGHFIEISLRRAGLT